MGMEELQVVHQEDDIVSQECLKWFPPIEQSWHNLVSLPQPQILNPERCSTFRSQDCKIC